VNNQPLTTQGADYSITVKPNCSLSPRQKIWVFLAVAIFPICVSTVFALLGAWLVLPFAGLELLALAFAFYLVHCHSGDYENITIAGGNLAIERREYKNTSRVVFQCYWARVILRDGPGGEQRLWLRSHGKEVEFGRNMSNDARLILAGQLKRRTGFVY
jgi:uncharacterized membrane protein